MSADEDRRSREVIDEDDALAWALKPLGDRVVVKPKGRDETTRSGIVLSDTASEKRRQDEVLSVARGGCSVAAHVPRWI